VDQRSQSKAGTSQGLSRTTTPTCDPHAIEKGEDGKVPQEDEGCLGSV
jgi:hypothetical protein